MWLVQPVLSTAVAGKKMMSGHLSYEEVGEVWILMFVLVLLWMGLV